MWFTILQSRKLRKSCDAIGLEYVLTISSPPEPEAQPEAAPGAALESQKEAP
jgi:hypothetical protein